MINEIIKVEGSLDKPKKALIAAGVQEANELVESGTIDAHEWLIRVKQLGEFLNGVETGLKDQALKEVAENGQYIQLGNAKIDISYTGDRYDYNSDPAIAMLQKQIDERKEILKLAIKARKSGNEVFDPETGEAIEPPPMSSHGKEIVKVQL